MTQKGQEALATVEVVGTVEGVTVIKVLTDAQQRYTWDNPPGPGLEIQGTVLCRYNQDGKNNDPNDPVFETLMSPVYEQISCACGNVELWILRTDDYETSGYCPKCKRLWEVHSG